MPHHANVTSFKKGRTPHNKGNYGIKKRNFFAGLPNYCEKHGEHLDWIYYEKNKMCACRLCRNERASKHQKLPENKLKIIFRDAKKHAVQRSREFNITLQDLEQLKVTQKNKCAISGVCFEDYGNNSISLDRINSTKGYTKDNIQFVTKIVNVMKSNFELKEFLDTCKLITKNIFINSNEKNY
jgi:hypothetical protein